VVIVQYIGQCFCIVAYEHIEASSINEYIYIYIYVCVCVCHVCVLLCLHCSHRATGYEYKED